jgi:hypothetical protein
MTIVIVVCPHPHLPVAVTGGQSGSSAGNADAGSRRDIVTTNRMVVGNISL